MKLLLLSKRFGTGKDSILEDFGRQVRLAESLTKAGAKVHLIAADYIKKQTFSTSLNNFKVTVLPFGFISFLKYIVKIRNIIKKENFDAIIASSDPIFGIIAYLTKQKTPLIYDAQDNYEEYTSHKIPFVKALEKMVLRKADFVICVSNPLLRSIKEYNKRVLVIPNGIDYNRIKPLDKLKARKKYKLPLKASVIAYAGIDYPRIVSIKFIIKSFNILKKKHKNVHLLLIGNGNKAIAKKFNDKTRITTFESVSYSILMELLSSADIFVLPYNDTPFTKMSNPYKLSEYMVFSKPIVCSDFGEMKSILNKYPQLIFKPNNSDDFVKKLELALRIGKVDYSEQLKKMLWDSIVKKLYDNIKILMK